MRQRLKMLSPESTFQKDTKMSAPDPETSWRLADWLFGAVLGLLSVVYTFTGKQIVSVKRDSEEKIKALKDEHDRRLGDVDSSVLKLFDRLEHFAQRAEDHHVEILKALHAGLDHKMDKP